MIHEDKLVIRKILVVYLNYPKNVENIDQVIRQADNLQHYFEKQFTNSDVAVVPVAKNIYDISIEVKLLNPQIVSKEEYQSIQDMISDVKSHILITKNTVRKGRGYSD